MAAIAVPASITRTAPDPSFARTRLAPAGNPTRKNSCCGLSTERSNVSASNPSVVGLTSESVSTCVFAYSTLAPSTVPSEPPSGAPDASTGVSDTPVPVSCTPSARPIGTFERQRLHRFDHRMLATTEFDLRDFVGRIAHDLLPSRQLRWTAGTVVDDAGERCSSELCGSPRIQALERGPGLFARDTRLRTGPPRRRPRLHLFALRRRARDHERTPQRRGRTPPSSSGQGRGRARRRGRGQR